MKKTMLFALAMILLLLPITIATVIKDSFSSNNLKYGMIDKTINGEAYKGKLAYWITPYKGNRGGVRLILEGDNKILELKGDIADSVLRDTSKGNFRETISEDNRMVITYKSKTVIHYNVIVQILDYRTFNNEVLLVVHNKQDILAMAVFVGKIENS